MSINSLASFLDIPKLSDNPKLLGRPKDFEININDIKLNNGAGFIVAYAGNILTMPGLGKHSNYEKF